MTLVELLAADSGTVRIGRFGVLELQTMDFHGSYRHAVKNLKDALRLHGSDFADVLQHNQRWLADRIEGPNIANVFKRTFYQMMLKFQLGVHPQSVGTALAIPQAVWDSWQPHLGRPHLVSQADGTYVLRGSDAGNSGVPAWVYVFDIDAKHDAHPSPIVVKRAIAAFPVGSGLRRTTRIVHRPQDRYKEAQCPARGPDRVHDRPRDRAA